MTYVSRGNQVLYLGEEDREELFLTVHKTSSTKTPEDQALLLANMLSQMPVVSDNDG